MVTNPSDKPQRAFTYGISICGAAASATAPSRSTPNGLPVTCISACLRLLGSNYKVVVLECAYVRDSREWLSRLIILDPAAIQQEMTDLC